MAADGGDDIASYLLAEAAAFELADYLARGRLLESVSNEDLQKQYSDLMEQFASSDVPVSPPPQINDVQAEASLRELKLVTSPHQLEWIAEMVKQVALDDDKLTDGIARYRRSRRRPN